MNTSRWDRLLRFGVGSEEEHAIPLARDCKRFVTFLHPDCIWP